MASRSRATTWPVKSARWGLLVFALACGLPSAWAVDWTALKPEGYLSDYARVVDPASRAEIERYCAQIERQTGAQIALVTVRSLEKEPIEDVANTIFRAWGVGQKGKNNGILLLLSVADRRSRMEVGYELEPLLPDGFAGSVLREMRPALRQNHYGEAMLAAAHTIGSRIAQAKGVSLDGAAPRRRIQPTPQDHIPWPLLLGGLALLFLLMRGSSRRSHRGGRGGGGFLPGFLIGNLLGNLSGRGGWSGGGHGGFGGYDSGDSFGGFGGGDSGGGGASSDW